MTATSLLRLDFGVIDARAADLLGLPTQEIRDQHIADLCGVSRETVSRWRNGHTSPQLTTALNLAAMLKISVQALTGQAEAARAA